jgi:hypothetical protein
MDESPLMTVGRITLGMLGIGIGIALTAFLTGQWISATIVPGLGAAEVQVVTSYTPLAFLSIAAFSAPIIAGVIGISEASKSTETKYAGTVAVACLVGAALMVMIAGVGIAFAEPSEPDPVNGGDGNGNESNVTNDTGADGTDGPNTGNDTSGNDTDGNGTDSNNTSGNDSGSGGGGDSGTPGPLDLVGLAGLAGVGALIAGFVATKTGA